MNSTRETVNTKNMYNTQTILQLDYLSRSRKLFRNLKDSMLWGNFISLLLFLSIGHTHHRHLGTYKVILTVYLVRLARFELWLQSLDLPNTETPPGASVAVCALLFPHLSLHLSSLYAVCPPHRAELEWKETGCPSAWRSRLQGAGESRAQRPGGLW